MGLQNSLVHKCRVMKSRDVQPSTKCDVTFWLRLCTLYMYKRIWPLLVFYTMHKGISFGSVRVHWCCILVEIACWFGITLHAWCSVVHVRVYCTFRGYFEHCTMNYFCNVFSRVVLLDCMDTSTFCTKLCSVKFFGCLSECRFKSRRHRNFRLTPHWRPKCCVTFPVLPRQWQLPVALSCNEFRI